MRFDPGAKREADHQDRDAQLGPALDLTEHAKQTDISAADKEALVAWIRLLDDVAREGNRELCLRLQRVCTEVFHSQGYPDAMLHGLWGLNIMYEL